MHKLTRTLLTHSSLILAFFSPALGPAQKTTAGNVLFHHSADIGVTQPGSDNFDPATQTYRVTGGGADMWGTADAFHFVWTQITGDAVVTGDIHFPAGAHAPLEKGVLIFRQSLDPGSQYADVALHADGHATLQFRTVPGGSTSDTVSSEHHATRFRIERKGDQFTAYVQSADGVMIPMTSTTVAMSGKVYVGLGVCAHNASGTTTLNFSNVAIDQQPVP